MKRLSLSGFQLKYIALITMVFDHIPVSYTHLDVYKRQLLKGAKEAMNGQSLAEHFGVTRQIIVRCV